jgi:hypothetical protein
VAAGKLSPLYILSTGDFAGATRAEVRLSGCGRERPRTETNGTRQTTKPAPIGRRPQGRQRQARVDRTTERSARLNGSGRNAEPTFPQPIRRDRRRKAEDPQDAIDRGFGQGDRSSGTNAARHGSADGEQTGASAPERDPEGPTGAERPPPEPGEGAGGNAGPFFASAATHWRRVYCCRERQRKSTTAGPNRAAATRQGAGRTEPSRAAPGAGHAPGAGDRSRTGARRCSGPGRRRRR